MITANEIESKAATRQKPKLSVTDVDDIVELTCILCEIALKCENRCAPQFKEIIQGFYNKHGNGDRRSGSLLDCNQAVRNKDRLPNVQEYSTHEYT